MCAKWCEHGMKVRYQSDVRSETHSSVQVASLGASDRHIHSFVFSVGAHRCWKFMARLENCFENLIRIAISSLSHCLAFGIFQSNIWIAKKKSREKTQRRSQLHTERLTQFFFVHNKYLIKVTEKFFCDKKKYRSGWTFFSSMSANEILGKWELLRGAQHAVMTNGKTWKIIPKKTQSARRRARKSASQCKFHVSEVDQLSTHSNSAAAREKTHTTCVMCEEKLKAKMKLWKC